MVLQYQATSEMVRVCMCVCVGVLYPVCSIKRRSSVVVFFNQCMWCVCVRVL